MTKVANDVDGVEPVEGDDGPGPPDDDPQAFDFRDPLIREHFERDGRLRVPRKCTAETWDHAHAWAACALDARARAVRILRERLGMQHGDAVAWDIQRMTERAVDLARTGRRPFGYPDEFRGFEVLASPHLNDIFCAAIVACPADANNKVPARYAARFVCRMTLWIERAVTDMIERARAGEAAPFRTTPSDFLGTISERERHRRFLMEMTPLYDGLWNLRRDAALLGATGDDACRRIEAAAEYLLHHLGDLSKLPAAMRPRSTLVEHGGELARDLEDLGDVSPSLRAGAAFLGAALRPGWSPDAPRWCRRAPDHLEVLARCGEEACAVAADPKRSKATATAQALRIAAEALGYDRETFTGGLFKRNSRLAPATKSAELKRNREARAKRRKRPG